MNQKIGTGIGLSVVAILAITCAVFTWKFLNRSQPVAVSSDQYISPLQPVKPKDEKKEIGPDRVTSLVTNFPPLDPQLSWSEPKKTTYFLRGWEKSKPVEKNLEGFEVISKPFQAYGRETPTEKRLADTDVEGYFRKQLASLGWESVQGFDADGAAGGMLRVYVKDGKYAVLDIRVLSVDKDEPAQCPCIHEAKLFYELQ